MDATHLRPGEGTHHRMTDGDHVAKVAVRDEQGAFEVFEIVAHAAPPSPPHISPWSAVLYLVEGRVRASVNGQEHDVEPGGVVVFPAGTPSTFEVVGESARFVGITSGDGAGRFFADFAASVPADRPVEESIGTILEVTARHGVRMAAPAV
ncbi:Cupin domain-containing protein [Nocardioides sp. J9]|uniref:cupin domain-containing protein n=1 Tax=Nocardioides sp. J9 TaxID=935844 RepID=UPI0011AAD48D|nr:cupin domain-containing protein [Nocardioides sp. J9]TWG99276.1 Cupin domain-containing protein [Nocardioides sp. J9]